MSNSKGGSNWGLNATLICEAEGKALVGNQMALGEDKWFSGEQTGDKAWGAVRLHRGEQPSLRLQGHAPALGKEALSLVCRLGCPELQTRSLLTVHLHPLQSLPRS